MTKRFITPLLVATAIAMSLSASGCASLKARSLLDSVEEPSSAQTRVGELSAEQAHKLQKELTGEVHAVYPTDAGLARVFGQVANLGSRPYTHVSFDIVSAEPNAETDGESTSVLTTFDVKGGLKPGEIKPFDVQTSSPMGGVETLRIVVSAAQ